MKLFERFLDHCIDGIAYWAWGAPENELEKDMEVGSRVHQGIVTFQGYRTTFINDFSFTYSPFCNRSSSFC